MKSDYLRKEAELYIDYISKGDDVSANQFMSKTIKDVNGGSLYLNTWVYEQTKALLDKNKLVGLLGGDHSVPLGFYKAIAEKFGDFGILQIDAHCDLRDAYETFNYSHASIMYNALNEVPELKKLVQVGPRDFSLSETEYVKNSEGRVVTYYDKAIKHRQYEGETWKTIVEEIVSHLPHNVYISFDIDGLDRKLCPHTGTPVPGGFETEEVYYLFRKVIESGRKIIGFDLCEVGVSDTDWNSNVGARVLFKLCNLLVASNS
jgi:agmatinase